jgi:hypothetical protein
MLANRYDWKPKEGAFIIDRALEEDQGNYTCALKDGESKTINVVGMFYSTFKSSMFFKLSS